MIRLRAKWVLAAALFATSASAQPPAKLADAPPGSLRIFASGAVRPPIIAVQAQLEKATGLKLVIESSESRTLQKEIEAGQGFEVAVLTTAVIKDEVTTGKIVAGTDAPFGVVWTGVAVRGDAPKLDVTTADGLKKAILGAHGVRRYYGVAASTPIVDNLFDKLGLNETTKDRMIRIENGAVPPEAPLVPGQYELIINLASAVIPMKGWTYLGRIPQQFQTPVYHSIGVGAAGDQAAGRKALAILNSPAFDAVLEASGSTRR